MSQLMRSEISVSPKKEQWKKPNHEATFLAHPSSVALKRALWHYASNGEWSVLIRLMITIRRYNYDNPASPFMQVGRKPGLRAVRDGGDDGGFAGIIR